MSRIIVVGGTASGKTYLKDRYVSRGFKFGISHTTREPREGEINGQHYYFVSDEQFNELIRRDKFYEYVEYSRYKYGRTKDEFYSADIFVMEPQGVSKIKEEDRKDTFIIFIDLSEEVRIERLKKRGTDLETIQKRIQKDRDIFGDFTDYDLLINNPNF
jgi:guanylate kinase